VKAPSPLDLPPPSATLTVRQAWLVETFADEDEEHEDIADWLDEHPDFEPWSPEEFQRVFVATGLLVVPGDGGGPGCPESGLLLFQTEQAALLYGTRKAGLASGVRRPLLVRYISLALNDLATLWPETGDASALQSRMLLPVYAGGNGFYVVGDNSLEHVVFEDDGAGLAAFSKLLAAWGLAESSVDFVPPREAAPEPSAP
jgi:hypothetical protein